MSRLVDNKEHKIIDVKKLAVGGLLMAMVFLTTYVTKIPMGSGFFNFGDIFVMVSAIIIGRKYGAAAGGIGSAMADIILGYTYYAPITLVVKGLEAYIVGRIATDKSENISKVRLITAVTIGAVIMISGYFLADSCVMRIVDKSYGLMAALAYLPYNAIQGFLSAIIAYGVITILNKANISKRIFE